MNKLVRLILHLFAGIFLVTSCHKEIYDPESLRKNFFISDVPTGFDWAALTSVNVCIVPNDIYDGKYFYTMEIYEGNPIVNSEAILLAKGVCKGLSPWETTISLPETLTTVYICQTDPSGKKSILTAEITSGNLDCNLKPQEDTKLLSRANIQFPVDGDDYQTDDSSYEIPNLPASGLQVFDPHHPTIEAGKDYLLNGNYSGNIDFERSQTKNSRLFIKGTWTLNSKSATTLPDKTQLIVLEGGKIVAAKDCDIHVYNQAKIYIAENGQIENKKDANITIQYMNAGELINKGKLYTKSIHTNSGNFNVYNSGELTCEKIEFQNEGQFINRGSAVFEEFYAATAKVNIVNSGTLYINDKIKINNSGILKNEKLLVIHEAELLKTHLINYDSIHLDELECEQGVLHNLHKIVAKKELDFKGTDIYNECRIETDELKLERSKLYLASQTSIYCKKLEADGAQIYIGNQALMTVKDEAEFTTQANYIYGDGSSFGLLQIGKIKWEGNRRNLNSSGNLEIDCQKFKDNTADSKYYSLSPPAHFAANGTTTKIPAGICTGTGNQPENGPAEDPKFPMWTNYPLDYTWLTEDTYPSPGDYDLNDLVIGFDSIAYSINEKNEVLEMKLYMQLKAVGALFRLGAAIQLDGIAPTNIKSVQKTGNIALTDLTFDVNTTGVETGQTYAVIPLFDNAHHVLGLPDSRTITNTISKGKLGYIVKPAQPFSVHICFNQAVSNSQVDISKLNFFAIVKNNFGIRNLEIHLPNFDYTDKSTTAEEIKENAEGLMWGLLVPLNFKYAAEKTDIRKAYPDFQNWVNSNKKENKDWYKNYIKENTYQP